MRRSDISINPDIFAAPKRELTERQQRFVDAYVTNGGESGPAAAEAGYSTASAVQAASQLLRKPLIQQAILKRTMSAIGLQAVPALAVISKLMASSKSDYVRLEAARDLLDRSGFQPPERVDHRLDSGLTVTIEFGGSKTGRSHYVTGPDTGKSRSELDPEQIPLIERNRHRPDFGGETLDLPAIVNNSTSHGVVFSKTEEEE
jgi:hypothetical protein